MINDPSIDIGDYYGCFSGNGWIKELHPDAWNHPARVAFGLSERIYQEAISKGWVSPGMTVLDPFCGIGGFAFHALTNGINFTGVEIEGEYAAMAQKNFDLWNERYAGKLARWGTARVILGDSQQISDHVSGVDMVVSSPTYCELKLHNPDEAAQQLFKEKSIFYGVSENYGKSSGQTGNMIPRVYWQVQEKIARQIAQILRPGGVAIWVVKRYVKNKRMQEFPTQWAELYQRLGYDIIAWRRAWQLEQNGTQLGMFENKVNQKDHRSFFRSRHARMFPDLKIDWEDVIITRRGDV